MESVDKREFYLVEHASAGNALVILTACTTARIGISVIAIIGMTAFLAFEAVCHFIEDKYSRHEASSVKRL